MKEVQPRPAAIASVPATPILSMQGNASAVEREIIVPRMALEWDQRLIKGYVRVEDPHVGSCHLRTLRMQNINVVSGRWCQYKIQLTVAKVKIRYASWLEENDVLQHHSRISTPNWSQSQVFHRRRPSPTPKWVYSKVPIQAPHSRSFVIDLQEPILLHDVSATLSLPCRKACPRWMHQLRLDYVKEQVRRNEKNNSLRFPNPFGTKNAPMRASFVIPYFLPWGSSKMRLSLPNQDYLQ